MTLLEISMITLAYLAGSFNAAVIVCRVMGFPDPRTQGSGNPGATNVMRQAGKKAGAFTFVLDVFKAVLPVLVAQWLHFSSFAIALVLIAAFLGHLFPIFFGFRGGKGVATAFGGIAVISWASALGALATFTIIAALFRYVSLASISAALLTPAYFYLFTRNPDYIAMSMVISGLLIARHHTNIRKLLRGEESKIGEGKK